MTTATTPRPAGTDRYGARAGSRYARLNAALDPRPRTAEQVARRAGLRVTPALLADYADHLGALAATGAILSPAPGRYAREAMRRGRPPGRPPEGAPKAPGKKAAPKRQKHEPGKKAEKPKPKPKEAASVAAVVIVWSEPSVSGGLTYWVSRCGRFRIHRGEGKAGTVYSASYLTPGGSWWTTETDPLGPGYPRRYASFEEAAAAARRHAEAGAAAPAAGDLAAIAASPASPPSAPPGPRRLRVARAELLALLHEAGYFNANKWDNARMAKFLADLHRIPEGEFDQVESAACRATYAAALAESRRIARTPGCKDAFEVYGDEAPAPVRDRLERARKRREAAAEVPERPAAAAPKVPERPAGRPQGKATQPGADGPPARPRGRPKATRQKNAAAGMDEYGTRLGTHCAAVNRALTAEPQSEAEIRRAAGVRHCIEYHLDKMVRLGFLGWREGEGYFLLPRK